MKTIGLEQLAFCFDATEQGRQQRDMLLSGERSKRVLELFCISHAVIGRQMYAHQQYTCSSVLNA